LTEDQVKILVVSQYFWPENFRINDLATELVKRGHEVTVLTGHPNYPTGKIFADFQAHPSRYEEYQGVKIVRVPLVPRGTGALQLALNYASFALSASWFGAFRLRGRKFDRIFVFEPSPITVGIPAILFRRTKKAPIVFWVLDLWPESLRAVGVVKSDLILNLVGKLVSFIYRRCDLILAQSQSFIEPIKKYCDDSQRVEFCPSWAEAIFENTSASDVAPELTPFAHKMKILFAGNIGEAQDFPSILDAAERVRNRLDIQWILIGQGRMAEWVNHEINKRGLTGTVSMLGAFPLDRMPSFYAGADALLVTLKKNDAFSMTIPGKVQTYLAAGKPMLGMLDGDGAKVIQEAESGYVCPSGDAISLANNVLRLAALSIKQRRDMGDAGRHYYGKTFDRDLVINKIEFFLNRPLGDSRVHL
jgi:colanic acid biosynthesis glycosyl transferase WcaI